MNIIYSIFISRLIRATPKISGLIAVRFLIVAGCMTNTAAFSQTPAIIPDVDKTIAAPGSVNFQSVTFDSLDTSGFFSSKPVPIKGFLLPSLGSAPVPAAILNPACEGQMTPDGTNIRPKYRRMAQLLHGRGITVLLIDGFNPRGFSETCAHQSKLDDIARLKDALGGLLYLRTRNDVDGARVMLVGWGANAGFEGMSQGSSTLAKVGLGFAGAVFYYPQCSKINSPFVPYAPIQVFVGGKDAWNPAAECTSAAQRQKSGSANFSIKIYPDAYHSFDSPFGEPKMNEFNPRLGMVGRNADATLDSYKMILAFISNLWPDLTKANKQ